MRTGLTSLLLGLLATAALAGDPAQPVGGVLPSTRTAPAAAEPITDLADSGALVRAELRLEKNAIQTGRPVWADLELTNLTNDPLTLQVPETPSEQTPADEMGLPMSHIFSGPGFTAVAIKDSHGDTFETQVALKPRGALPILRLAPHASVGTRLDLTATYETLLRRPGKYTLVWRPYGGQIESPPVTVTLLAEQQAVILTDSGRMVVRFYYEAAPQHVQNFLELVTTRFYDNLTFHRIVHGGIIQGGDPRGDGFGIRPDGKRLTAEFNKITFEAGTVGMARRSKDPDSASCQFFICADRQAALDNQQTAFGRLVGDESFETLRKLADLPTGPKDRPQKTVYIRAISLENVPEREREVPASLGGNTGTRPAAAGVGTGTRPSPSSGVLAAAGQTSVMPAAAESNFVRRIPAPLPSPGKAFRLNRVSATRPWSSGR
jgi:peptidyl-prolyl cis-trans isomerase B (cyclophilin B)